jgi:hypothetical protein
LTLPFSGICKTLLSTAGFVVGLGLRGDFALGIALLLKTRRMGFDPTH